MGLMGLRLVLLVGFLTYIVDVTLDCFLAVSHGRNSDWNWMGMTIFFISFCSLINGLCTCVTILPQNENTAEFSFVTKCIGVVMSSLMLGPVFWDFHALRNTMKRAKSNSNEEQSEDPDKKYVAKAQDSAIMGTIERGVEAAGESIPQWTLQIYVVGIANKISVLQLAGLFSSLFGATYCVIDATRSLVKTLSEHRKSRSHVWDYSFILFGIWMVLAMMTYLSVIALFGSRFGGGWLFLFLPTFYVFVVSHTLLLKSKNCKRELKQRISILIQIVVCVVTQTLLYLWEPSTPLSFQIKPSISASQNLHLNLKDLGPTDITIGFRNNPTQHYNFKGIGRQFRASLEFVSNGGDLRKNADAPYENFCNHSSSKNTNSQCVRSFDLKLTLTEDLTNIENKTYFGANSCNEDKFEWTDVTEVKDPMELFNVFSNATVFCLSEISDVVATFLSYTNCIWLGYHIFLVISLDWIFLDESQSSEDPAPRQTTANSPFGRFRQSMARNIYVNANGDRGGIEEADVSI